MSTATHDPNIRCQQFCTEPIGPDGEPGGDGWKANCPQCEKALLLLCDEVLPAIWRDGYWTPPDADVDGELNAMIDQREFRPKMFALLDELNVHCAGCGEKVSGCGCQR